MQLFVEFYFGLQRKALYGAAKRITTEKQSLMPNKIHSLAVALQLALRIE
jgi:hypothetical protein